jgi:hypothetical protein
MDVFTLLTRKEAQLKRQMRSKGRTYKRRADAVQVLVEQGWHQSRHDRTHFSHPEMPYTSRRVLKAKHNEWFISIVS